MEQGDDSKRKLESFLAQLSITATRPIDLPADQREVYFKLVKGNVFPVFKKLGEEVARKGMPAPRTVDIPSFYAHQTVDGGRTEAEWLSISVITPITPKPVIVEGKVIGNVISTLYVSDSAKSISFLTLDNGNVVLINENRDGSERVLNTPDALFETIPSHRLFPAGNPAAWINKVVERNMLAKMKVELDTLPERK
jgi:hypothetical protein